MEGEAEEGFKCCVTRSRLLSAGSKTSRESKQTDPPRDKRTSVVSVVSTQQYESNTDRASRAESRVPKCKFL